MTIIGITGLYTQLNSVLAARRSISLPYFISGPPRFRIHRVFAWEAAQMIPNITLQPRGATVRMERSWPTTLVWLCEESRASISSLLKAAYKSQPSIFGSCMITIRLLIACIAGLIRHRSQDYWLAGQLNRILIDTAFLALMWIMTARGRSKWWLKRVSSSKIYFPWASRRMTRMKVISCLVDTMTRHLKGTHSILPSSNNAWIIKASSISITTTDTSSGRNISRISGYPFNV